jgi:thiol-disulfide isomerase/thioredoxin
MAQSFFVRNAKNLIGAAIILLAGAGATYDLYFETPPIAEASLVATIHTKKWPAAPNFLFTDINGKRHKLSDFKGRIVLIDFWASWCQPCIAEFPRVVDFVAKHNGDIVLIALSSDSGTAPIHDFIAKQSAETQTALQAPYMFVALDEGRKITRDTFLTELYPETIFISPDMRMVKKAVGDAQWDSPDMADFINMLAKTETP